MANKRVIDMQELSELGDGWYTFLDSATGGTKKFDMGNMLNATADAQDAAEAAQSAATSAREAADGVVSPTVTPSQITGGTRVTITDVDGTRTFDVMDGPQGEKGDTGDPAAPGSITTDMLADEAVTHDKLAPGVADGYQPTLVAGSSRAMLGDPETASWMERTTAADGAALIESVKGNTLRWNQLSVTQSKLTVGGIAFAAGTRIVSGYKYLLKAKATVGSSSAQIALFCNNGSNVLQGTINASSDGYVASVFTATVSGTSNGTMSNVQGNVWMYVSISSGATGFDDIQLFDLTAMFGAGNEPATVAEFEALFPEPYYPYDAGSLLPVRMEGVETVGFNQWDEEWELGSLDSSGQPTESTSSIRSKNFIPVLPSTAYYVAGLTSGELRPYYYDSAKAFVSRDYWIGGTANNPFTIPSNARYMKFAMASSYGATYNHDICINISDPSRNGTYEPHWSSQRTIPAATYFPDGMRGVGTGDSMVCDELTNHEAIHRVGEYTFTGEETWLQTDDGSFYFESRDNSIFASAAQNSYVTATFAGTLDATHLTYNSIRTLDDKRISAQNYTASDGMDISRFWLSKGCGSSVADVQTLTAGKTVHYALATPTTTPIDPPLPLSYRTGAGGTERVMVASGTTSAPPVFATRYPLDPADLAASIAPVDGPIANTNHQVGDLIMLGFTLCKATQVIVTGETIAIGTNVTKTTVATELAALSQ